MSENTTRKPITLRRLQDMSRSGEKIAMLTCYDASFARALDEAGVDVLLVGDSLGMVIQGHPSTLPVSMEEMEYHTRCVARGNGSAWIIADMPFGSYQESIDQAVRNAARLMKAGAHMVKLEGGGWTAPCVQALVERGNAGDRAHAGRAGAGDHGRTLDPGHRNRRGSGLQRPGPGAA